MNTLNKLEFLKKVIQNDENLSEQLTEEQRQTFIEACIENIEVFKQEIQQLVKQYDECKVSPIIEQNEQEMVDGSKLSLSLLQETTKSIRQSYSEINKALTEMLELTPLYHSLLSELLPLQETVQKNLESAIKDNQSMLGLIENRGMITLHNRLVFCTEILLEIPYQSLRTSDFYSHYEEIARLVSEFWFNDGIEPSFYDETKQIRSRQHSNNIFLALALSFLTLDGHKTVTTRSCYLQLSTKAFSLEDNYDFSLKQFSKDYPSQFIQLDDLFSKTEEFYKHRHQLLQNDHLYVRFNEALFHLYLYQAHLINELEGNKAEYDYLEVVDGKVVNDYLEQALEAKALALKHLLHCFKQGLEEAEAILIQQLADSGEVHLDECIELVNIYYSKGKTTELSLKLYQNFKQWHYTLSELSPLGEPLRQLLYYWAVNESDERGLFGKTNLFKMCRNAKDNNSYKLSKELAIKSPQNALLFAKAIIHPDSKKERWKEVLTILEVLDEQQGEHLYYRYYIISKLDKVMHYPLLLAAVEQKEERAIADFNALCRSENTETRVIAYDAIVRALSAKSSYVLELLEDHYHTGIMIFHQNEYLIYQLIHYFYPHLLRSKNNDQAIQFLYQLTTGLKQLNRPCIEKLIAEAKTHFPTALFLVEFCLENPSNSKSLTLVEHVLAPCHQNFFEKTYCLYFTHGKVQAQGFDLLFSAASAGQREAISHLMAMVHYLRKNPKLLDNKEVRDNVFPACLQILGNMAFSNYLAAETLCLYFTKQNARSMTKHYYKLCCQHKGAEALLQEQLKNEGLSKVFLELVEGDSGNKSGFFGQNSVNQQPEPQHESSLKLNG